ncbi:MAG: insulinase family protein [Clostridia bacterium]|nr:insulinase family protein [Clostridia bacterium]
MQVIENLNIKEKVYIEKLENGMTFMFIPKNNTQKKYVIWGTHYGSNESKFIVPGEQEPIEVPKGVAHFLEHKMFEQENGRNSLDVLTALGVNANAYTTNDHTAYLFECTDKFYEALDELMDYVQHPYFTDENVEKEKGIIGQEIMMYDDYPEWKVYLNALEAMYHNHPVKLDITGTIETISHIDKDILYKCYNTFYNPSNMALVVCGDFEPEEILNEVKSRLIDKKSNGEIKRIYPDEPAEIVQENINQEMEVSMPLFAIGIKDKPNKSIVKRSLAIEILLNMIIGRSSKLYKNMYNEGILFIQPSLEYEFTENYAHILITGQSTNPEKLMSEFKNTVRELKENGINLDDFERIKKMIYGNFVKEYNDVEDTARMFLADFFKGINSFEYIDEMNSINLDYTKQILEEVFVEKNMILSTVKSSSKNTQN